MSGFVPMEASWWPAVREGMARPWPREAALMDLRWHADRERVAGEEPPGRPALAARWGWTEWQVRTLCRSSEWSDRWTSRDDERTSPRTEAGNSGNSASAPPVGRQRSASAPPVPTPANADSSPDSASAPPVGRQSAASKPPSRERYCSPDHPTPHTGGPESGTAGAAPAAEGPPAPAVETPRDPPRPSPVPGYRDTILAFEAEHRAILGVNYPWVFRGRDHDGHRVKLWLEAAKVTADDPAEGVERIRGAARAYFRAVEAKTAWPPGEPATTRHFTREFARWLQVDPASEPTGPPPRASPGRRSSRTADIEAALARAAANLHEQNSRSNHPKEPAHALP